MLPSSLKLHCHHFHLVKAIVSENNHKLKTNLFQSNILRQLYFQKLLSVESSVLCCECCHGWAPLFQASVFWSFLIASHFFDFLPSPIWFSLAFPYQLSEGKWEEETRKQGDAPRLAFQWKQEGLEMREKVCEAWCFHDSINLLLDWRERLSFLHGWAVRMSDAGFGGHGWKLFYENYRIIPWWTQPSG